MGVTRGWDDANRLLSMANNVSALDYQYDNAGQVLVEGSTVQGSGGGTNTVRKQLNYCRYPSGEVSQLTYPNGSTVVNRFYTARGQLEGVGWGAESTSYVYHPDGKVNYQAFTGTGGVTTTYGYDGRGMISSVSHTNASNQSLAYREYWRDERDRIVAWKRGIGGPNGMEDGRGDRYRYDPEGQLVRAWYRAQNPETENPGDPKRGDEFHYDALGNRAGTNRVASRGVMNFERKNNKLNQYRGWWPYSITNYDEDLGGWGEPGEANGVMMQDGWITASFNALNQPMGMWSPVNSGTGNYMWFGYDPLGRCVKRWVSPLVDVHAPPPSANPATYFYYDGWNLVQEGSSGNATDRIYVHGGRVDEVVASWAGGEWRHHHYDARGHCILQTDPTGTIREQYDYDAFGMPYFYNAQGVKLGTSAQWGNRFLFTGREWLKDLKVYDYRNRMYQPELGRFLQPDPIQFKAGDYNLYRYCHNDPINRTNPDGLYGRGDGWEGKDKEWEKFDRAQQTAAGRLERASTKMDAKVFEKVFGKDSATANNMAKVQNTMQKMAAALRDDGTRGFVANAMSESSRTMAQAPQGGKTVEVNVAHPSFGNSYALAWAAGHESGHSAGLGHGTVNGVTAYRNSSNKAERAAYDNLPPAARLGNPDNYMDFAR